MKRKTGAKKFKIETTRNKYVLQIFFHVHNRLRIWNHFLIESIYNERRLSIYWVDG